MGKVWILKGSKVPFILRRVDEGRYRVGEAYVHEITYVEEEHRLDNSENPLTGIRYHSSDDECTESLEDERSLDLDSGSDAMESIVLEDDFEESASLGTGTQPKPFKRHVGHVLLAPLA